MTKYITGIGGSGNAQYFHDQDGNPRFMLCDEFWGLPTNAGAYSNTVDQDLDYYFSTRSSQGYTAMYTDPFGNLNGGGAYQNGNTWDNVAPFSSGVDPGSGFNNTFWTRVDYMLASAASNGITVFLDVANYYDAGVSGGVSNAWTTTQWQQFGVLLGGRYGATPNLIWITGNDYYGTYNSSLDSLLTGIRSTGDTHPISVEMYSTGTTSREDLSSPGTQGDGGFSWGEANAQYNWCYYYEPTYLAIEQAYAETSTILPVFLGDGYFYGDGGGSPWTQDNQLSRNFAWWPLASGARGITNGSDAAYQWPSTGRATLTSEPYYENVAGKIAALYESLPDWWKLVPDTASNLVTAGRGTHASYSNQFYLANTDDYVAASVTPGGSLAVLYGAQGVDVTINQSVMQPGYTARWADPATGAITSATTGSTYNSAPLSTNSQGGSDWVLILQGPAAAPPAPAFANSMGMS